MPRDSTTQISITSADLCHPTLRQRAFTRPGWLFELKHDGFRALVTKEGDSIGIVSRKGRSMGPAFPELVSPLATVPCNAVLDCELVVPDGNGKSDFERLRRRNLLTRRELIDYAAATEPAILVCFEVLAARRQDLRSKSLGTRRDWLHRYVNAIPRMQIIESVETHGEALFAWRAVLRRTGWTNI